MMATIKDDVRRDFITELRRVRRCLASEVSVLDMDSVQVLRLSGIGVSLLLGLAVEMLGADSEREGDDSGQLRLF